MSDIVSDAREWLDGYAGRESTHSDECHKWHDACLIARLVSECERLRQVVEQKNLTDEEREAVEYYVGTGGPDSVDATLRALLSRTGKNLRQTSDNAAECGSQGEKLPERDRLTGAEREAVERAADLIDAKTCGDSSMLRELLERLG